MYEKCINCERLGKECIPNLYVMSVVEVRDWARKLKEAKGWSNAYLAEVSGVPKGTIDSNFSKKSGKCSDVNYSTFSPVLCALIGCDHEEMPRYTVPENDGMLAAKVMQLESENEILQEKACKLEQRLNVTEERYDSRISYMKEQLKWRKQVIVIMLVICCILLTFILIGIYIDWYSSDMGFFWR